MVCYETTKNLLVITVVSYFGAKFHRVMGIGTLIMALPHFMMDW